uniref:Conserved domain protein n=1 Tax=Strongyloides papillosus TaxID=174720 RepID=A0A0N5B331_STREA
MFGVIISKSKAVENKNNSKKHNVVLEGFLKCPDCNGRRYVTVNLEEEYMVQQINKECAKTFYIYRNFTNPNREVYKAGFYYFCNNWQEANITSKPARWEGKYDGVDYYTFGFIDLTETKKSKNFKRRNALENTISE